MPSDYHISAEFLPAKSGDLFTVMLAPVKTDPLGAVLFLPPFAEEMHKSRRTVAQQARALAALGYHVTLLDLPGCGDSQGQFADASWQGWKDAARHAAAQLGERTGVPVSLLGPQVGRAPGL